MDNREFDIWDYWSPEYIEDIKTITLLSEVYNFLSEEYGSLEYAEEGEFLAPKARPIVEKISKRIEELMKV